MDTQQLRAYVAVAEDLHFGRAAQRLHVAQPHLSRTIQSLESELGVSLFHRTTRRVELSPAGRALLDHARTILAVEAEARADVVAARDGRIGRVRLSFAGPSAHVAVAQLARAVREQHPLIDLELLPGRHGATATAELLQNGADLVHARFAEAPTGASSRVVGHDRIVAAVPQEHPLAARSGLRIADLRDQPLVAFPESHGSAVRSVLVARCEAAGFAPRFVQSGPDSSTCVALVAAGVGLHLTTERTMAYLPGEGLVIQEVLDPLPALTTRLVWRTDDDAPALHRVLRTAEAVLPSPDTD